VINRSVDERSDLYSLGIIFYQLLAGRLPFEGKSTGSIIHQQIAMPPLPPSRHNESISETLEKIILKLLGKEPAQVIGIVDRAIKLQLLEEDLQERGKLFFVHDRIKEAFYKKCGDKDRNELHRQIARTMEQMNLGATEKVIFELAYHYIEGKDEEKILEYGYPAGIKAKEHYAYEEALRYLSLIDRIIEDRGGRGKELWINTNRNISEIYLIIGKNDEAIDISRKILPFLESKIKKADIYKQITAAYFKKGDWQKCEEYGKQGLSLLGENLPVGKGAALFRIIKEFTIHIIHNILPKIFVHGKVLFKTPKYNEYFKENFREFDALEFIAEITAHIPPKHKQYIL